MDNLEPAYQANEIRNNLDKLDTLIDDLSKRESRVLADVYQSINIILRAQYALLKKPALSIIKE